MENQETSRTRIDQYIVMWDMYGLEAIINVSEGEREGIVQALKGETVTWRNPIQFMILRARFNSQRCYEIYCFDSELDEDELIRLFTDDPQLMANTIRRVGQKLYSDRATKTQVIT